MEDYNRAMAVPAGRGPTQQASPLDMLASQTRRLIEQVSKMCAELSTYNEKTIGSQPQTPGNPREVLSVPIPFGGVVGELGSSVNQLAAEIQNLQHELRRIQQL